MEKQEKISPQSEDLVRAQLSLRAVVWDISEKLGRETAKLDRELAYFEIAKLELKTGQKCPGARERYGELQQLLRQAGFHEKEALLVTDDAYLAEYAGHTAGMGQKEEGCCGLCVVFYERPGSRMDVSAEMVVQGFAEVGAQFLDRMHKRRNRIPWNILYTKRTCVRELQMRDLDELYEIYAGEGMTDYVEPLFERQEEAAYIKSYIDCMYYYYGYGMWAVCDKTTGRLLGRAGIEHRETGGGVLMELGYMIRKECQRKGYAYEVCSAVLEYALQELEMEEMHCFIDCRNQASIRTAEKLGFQKCAGLEGREAHMLHYRKILK